MIIRGDIGFDGERCLVFTEQHLEDDVFIGRRPAIKHELQIRSHRNDFVITPVRIVQLLQIADLPTAAIEIQQAGKRHHHRVVSIAERSTGMSKSNTTVGLDNDFTQQITLGERLNITAER